LEGYTVRIINKNLWRFANVMAFDDAYQEAYVKFLELRDRYAGQIDSPKWFMALYKTSLANRITDFANQGRRFRRQVCFTDLGDTMGSDGDIVPYQELLEGDLDTEALFEIKLDEAPDYVRQVLALIIRSRPDMLDAVTESWFDRGKTKDGGNQFLCALLGYDHREVDLVYAVRHYLEEVL